MKILGKMWLLFFVVILASCGGGEPSEKELQSMMVEQLEIVENEFSEGMIGIMMKSFQAEIKITLKNFKKDWCKKDGGSLYRCQVHLIVGYSTSNQKFRNYLKMVMPGVGRDDSKTLDILVEKVGDRWTLRE